MYTPLYLKLLLPRLSMLLLIVFSAMPVLAQVRLPQIFQSNMVLQRDKPIAVWGWASPRETVSVEMQGQVKETRAGKDGKWQLQLPAMSAGGPYEMKVKGKNEIVLTNILMGDIWLCGGQSNMQFRVEESGFQEVDTAWVNTAEIRLFTVHTDTDYMPREDIKGTGWKMLSLDNINSFSAVAYHFGKHIHQNMDIPIGLISDNLGATSVETWMSNEALMAFPQFEKVIGNIVKEGKGFEALRADFEKMKPKWFERYYYKGIGIEEQWYKSETDISDWKPIEVAGNTWESEADLRDHDGAVWFRTPFDLPENYAQETFPIGLLQIDDYDIAWVNGVQVGETYGKHNHRNYTVATSLLKPKGNILVVRVFDVGGIGGFTTSAFWGNPILWGKWLYKKGMTLDPDKFPKPNLPNASPFSSPAVLYNANIAPLTPLRIKGVIWYQGESNVDRAYEYRSLFPALIKDWRKQWGLPDMPFLFVQLANYMEESSVPQDNNWAELREAQAMALELPHTGMATAIDLGEADDIHPKNKQDVGKRLGMAAMAVAYSQPTISSGPIFKAMNIEKNKAVITFDHVGGGLLTKDKFGYVRGFQIAGKDKKFYWAKAHIQEGAVEVWSENVPEPIAVRYAWSNNPAVDLYNKEGLPAIPFRTDKWKGMTEGVIFEDGPKF